MCDKVDNVQNSTQETTIRVGRQAMSRVVISFFPTRASERRAVLLRIHETAVLVWGFAQSPTVAL